MRIGRTSVIHFASMLFSTMIGFAATFVIASIDGPGTLGAYREIVAVAIWLHVFGDLGIGTAITKRLSERDNPEGYLGAGLVLQIALFVVFGLVLVALRGPINDYAGFRATGYVIIMYVVMASAALLRAVLRGQHLVHIVGLLSPVKRIVRSGSEIAAILMGFGLVGLLSGRVLAGVVGIVLTAVFVSVRPQLPRPGQMRNLLSYGIYAMLARIESRTFNSMDTIILGVFVADPLIGFYEASWSISQALSIFGSSVSQALFPAISDLTSDGNRKAAAELINDGLAFAGLFLIPGFVGTFLLGKSVLTLYGSSFAKGYSVIVYLVASQLFYAYENQFTNALGAIDRPDLAFRVNVVFLSANMILNVLLVWQFGWVGAAVATMVSAFAGLLVAYITLDSVIDVPIPFEEIARQLAAAAVMGLSVLAGQSLFPETLFWTLVLVIFGAGVYFVLLLGLSARFRGTLRDNLPKSLRIGPIA